MPNVVKYKNIYVRANPKNSKELQYTQTLAPNALWQKCYTFPSDILALEIENDDLFVVLTNKTGYKASSGVYAFNKFYFSSGDKIFRSYFV